MSRWMVADLESAAEVRNVTKHFGRIRALDGVTLQVARRSIHGLLGPNGAGKTTLLRLMLGLSSPDSGTVLLGSGTEDSSRAPRLAFQPEDPAPYDYLKVREFLSLALHMRSDGRFDEESLEYWMRRFELITVEKQLIKDVSAGVRRKLSIVAALVQEPDLLVLDEPTNHLDTRAVLALKEELRLIRERGRSVLLATHMIDFAATLCDHFTLLKDGRVIQDGDPATLAGGASENLERRIVSLLEL